jgi:hypothetical protein
MRWVLRWPVLSCIKVGRKKGSGTAIPGEKGGKGGGGARGSGGGGRSSGGERKRCDFNMRMFPILLRYENVPHFCFHCGRMGHATVNCGEGGSNEDGIHFGEELRASPPYRAREIFVQQASTHVVHQLFQAKGQGTSTPYRRHGVQGRNHGQEGLEQSSSEASTPCKMVDQHSRRDDARINDELATGVKEMQVTCNSGKTMKGTSKEVGKGGFLLGQICPLMKSLLHQNTLSWVCTR